jgi:hypothetical protein
LTPFFFLPEIELQVGSNTFTTSILKQQETVDREYRYRGERSYNRLNTQHQYRGNAQWLLYRGMHNGICIVGMHNSIHIVGMQNSIHIVGMHNSIHIVGMHNSVGVVGMHNGIRIVGINKKEMAIDKANCFRHNNRKTEKTPGMET